jgi:hypothetical protein
MRLIGKGESLAVEMDQEDRLADPRLQERYPLRGEYTVSDEMTIEQIANLILDRDWYWCNRQEVIAYSLIHFQDKAFLVAYTSYAQVFLQYQALRVKENGELGETSGTCLTLTEALDRAQQMPL